MRAGWSRGIIELRHMLSTPQDLWTFFFFTAILLAVTIFMRGSTVEGTSFSLGSMTLPSILGMSIASGGLTNLTQMLTVEREDGTLLRAKAVPDGMLGYLVGKVVLVSGLTLVNIAALLIPGLFLFSGIATGGVGSWLTFAWVLALGLAACLPLGAILGSMFSNPRMMGLIMFPIMGAVGISGIFYPTSALPEWLQGIAQVLPIYWLGLGMRSALLPDGLSAVEIGHSWRHLETLGVLGLWAAFGLTVAPIVLRRMARRESGSSVAARREKAMQRVT
ncbi:ABC transporter permease [Solihabitans fulvus]|uniref:ABC transporter permease n=1 Tax=Solihabitans fulvus TaxID=1892852 RepID=A0A5B2XEK0_9PSEU|nr:ABC transporter permease [Solihabitans fulvus]KAA2261202.1 ABC transporter permease [Solihabitans fulvus]